MARYLVTGGCGFIGSHLCDALIANGHEVVILDNLSSGRMENKNPGAALIVGDVTDQPTIEGALSGADGCFHLAAVTSVERGNKEWVATHRTNLTGTIMLLNAARANGSRARPLPIVYASSAAVYGDNESVPLAESAPARPISAYGADKLACELHARVADRVHDVPTTGLRFFNVYGPRQDPSSPYSGVIAIFSERLKGRLPITIFGDGRQERDFVYVADVVRALLAAMGGTATSAPIYNVCSGKAVSVRALADMLGRLCGTEPRIEFAPPRAGDIRRSLGNAEAIRRALSWRPEIALEEGLRRTIGDLSARS